jgi:ABC-type transporter Mla subunit MlaD
VSNDEVTAEELAKLLRAIQTALVGDDESTLISQLKLTRQDTNDRLDSLKKAQHEALQRLSEMGSAKLVDALREVIRDFNSKITEQFGENFKELNAAVGKLVQWQDRYRTHTEELTHQIMQITASMKESSEHYSSLVDKAEIFTRVSNELSSLLSAIEVQKQQLISSLESLANLLQAASGSLPQIEAKVMELVTQLSSAVRASQLEVNKSIAENSELLRTSIQQAGTQLANHLSEQQKELGMRVQEHVSAIRSAITAAGQEMGKANQEMNKQVADLTMKTRQQVTTLDEALSDELTKSLESLGRQLTALSQRFVEDYSPLTEKLRRVVELARG